MITIDVVNIDSGVFAPTELFTAEREKEPVVV
jgi:hypothetical protein